MQKHKNISSLFYGLLAFFFLVAPIASNFVEARPATIQVEAAESQESSEEEDEATYLSELSLDVIIPSFAFSFDGQSFFQVPSESFNFELVPTLQSPQYANGYAFRYFDKVFEHTIAVNAP